MGKQQGNQEKGPNLSAVPNKDLVQRMNFLYQVASHLSQQPEVVEESKSHEPSSKKRRKRKGTLKDLAAFHVRSMKAIGTKSMVKIDPSVKRTICKVCFVPMLPGATSRTRINASRAHRFVVVQTCSTCGWTRSMPSPPYPTTDVTEPDQILTRLQDEPINSKSKRSKRMATGLSRREASSIRSPPLFQRPGHVVQMGNTSKSAGVTGEDAMMGEAANASSEQ